MGAGWPCRQTIFATAIEAVADALVLSHSVVHVGMCKELTLLQVVLVSLALAFAAITELACAASQRVTVPAAKAAAAARWAAAYE